MAEPHSPHAKQFEKNSGSRRVGWVKTAIVGAVLGTGAGFAANLHHVPLAQNIITTDTAKVAQARAESTSAAGQFFVNLQRLSPACANTVTIDLNGLNTGTVENQATAHKDNTTDKSCAKDDINNLIVVDAYAQQYRSAQQQENSAAITLNHDQSQRHWVYNNSFRRPIEGFAAGTALGLVSGGVMYAAGRRRDARLEPQHA